MQSTGQTSTQAVSLVPMQGSAMMYMPIGQLLLQKERDSNRGTVVFAAPGGLYPSGSPAIGSPKGARPLAWPPGSAPPPATRVVSLGYFAKLGRVANGDGDR